MTQLLDPATIARLAGLLSGKAFSTGDHAALRRMDPASPGKAALALHRSLALAGVEAQGGDSRWALIAHCLALARGRHDPKKKAGKVLRDMRFSEARLTQLLAADAAALLNRDEAGLAKRIPFGGATRGRISSQCMKRHWRFAGAEDHDNAKANLWSLQNLSQPMGLRTKRIVEDVLLKEAEQHVSGVSEVMRKAVQAALLKGLYAKEAGDPQKRQALFFGEPEIAYLF
jgi:hypothetical protein